MEKEITLTVTPGIIAHLADSSKVYPFYFNSVTDEVYTVMEVYENYLAQREYLAEPTFSYFLNASRDDKNADTLYGFEI